MSRCKTKWKKLTLEVALSSLENRTLPSPSVDDYEHILQQCRKVKNQNYALRLHACMCQRGLDSHEVLGNSLVTTLVNVGSMSHAQQVFDTLFCRSESTWNALIMGYIQYGKANHALNLYRQMQDHESVQPAERTIVALLKACTKLKDLETGCVLHASVADLGLLEDNVFVGATLVDMYAKCGLLNEARQVLDKLQIRDVVSWNALISGFTDYEYNAEALECYEYLQLEGLSPNAVTIVCALKACGGLKAVEKGCEMHAEIARSGLFEASVFVGNSLVDMYARCSLLSKAQEVYNQLPVKDVVSCNALIVGYLEHGDSKDALRCFKLMEFEGIAPNSVTYICSLKASGKAEDILTGREIHGEVARQGFLGKDVALGNALIDMYAKCGVLAKAQDVFDRLPFHDVVSCNALIAGYAEYGLGEEALKCFRQMKVEGVAPDIITYICILKACGSVGLIGEGQDIHADITKLGLLEGDLGIGNSLIDLYCKCGWCAEAQDIFDTLPSRDLVSWNTITAGYVEHGYAEEGLECFEQMQLEGIMPNAVTFASVIKACGEARALYKCQEVHGEIIRRGLLQDDPFVGSALVDAYINCSVPGNAEEVFDTLLYRDTVIWNALIAGYVEHDFGHKALMCFERMQLQGVPSDSVTLLCMLQACANVGANDKGREIHTEIVEKGLANKNVVIGNTLVDMYAKFGALVDAQGLLDKLEVRDVVSWNALIAGFAQVGESEKLFLSLDQMMEDGVKPNAVTFLCVLKACSHATLFEKGKAIFNDMLDDYGVVPTLEHQNCMVDLLCRAGQLEEATAMAQKMHSLPNVVVWDSVLSACKKWGSIEFGMQAFENFIQLDVDDAGAYVSMSHILATTVDNTTAEFSINLAEKGLRLQ